ncbi:venom carboxylesterase-6 isoform X1 [Diabrotica virgifera virgifera]|uniref:Carboxylic ester hydrolase n=1 Tax=Diabrotica virgifera virgifera TaxID=50390 RepID=A0ABM5IYH3_DIAVI|nr:venom carboxylesterase-6 isoform X1 [Diabrotica virgifera virgifera]
MRWFYFLVLFPGLLHINAEIIVTTPNGKIRGRQEYSQRGISFYAFQQIPFAQPPIGSLRFKAPVPAEPWSGILDATKNDRLCFQQTNMLGPGITPLQNEDCLYLNVYTPMDPSKNGSLPVMFYIYGGGFVNGANNFDYNGPHYLMEYDVIIVNVNYRVGPFGFLSTGDTVIPGNNGLKDQLLGLKWVQENIEYFGGDKTKVTIFGESAGAASVTYQLMSQKSKGLFRAAIAQSGSILSPWTFQRNYRDIAYGLSVQLDPTFDPKASSQELLEFLQSKTAEKVNDAAKSMMSQTFINNQIIQGFQFTPVIEPNHDDAFITKRMYEAIINGEMQRVPLILGICSEEMIWDALDPESFKWTARALDSNLSLLVNDNMRIEDASQKQTVGAAIRQVYTDGLFIDKIGNAVEFFSDTSFGRSIIHHAKKQSQFSDVYFYQFSYYGSIPGVRPYIEGAYKVAHSDDNQYIWVSMNNSNLNTYPKGDVLTSERFLTLFTNFAKSLDPVANNTELLGITSWPKVTPNDFHYLDINETLTIKKDLKRDVYEGWVKVYEKYAVKPYDTF